MKRLLLIALSSCLPTAFGGEADVLKVDVACNSATSFRFDVTVKHDDQGWTHYANRWEVLSPDGELLATRVLAHPHDHEQPFTRSLTNVNIPDDLAEVVVRAHDLEHGYGGKELRVRLPR